MQTTQWLEVIYLTHEIKLGQEEVLKGEKR